MNDLKRKCQFCSKVFRGHGCAVKCKEHEEIWHEHLLWPVTKNEPCEYCGEAKKLSLVVSVYDTRGNGRVIQNYVHRHYADKHTCEGKEASDKALGQMSAKLNAAMRPLIQKALRGGDKNV